MIEYQPFGMCDSNSYHSIIYSYFEIAAKEGDMAGLKGMVMG